MGCCNTCGGSCSSVGCCNQACTPACAEDHTLETVVKCYVTSVRPDNPWVVPACGATASLIIPNLKQILLNSYLWNPVYGYFRIVGFNLATGLVTVINDCTAGNAAPGTAIPRCTEFIVSAAPCGECTDTDGICVTVDFVAPEIGACLDITVTTTVGLTLGDTVGIGSGQYRVGAIVSQTVVNICNDGLGLLPGTIVTALNAFGQYQYCLFIVSNCCTTIEDRFGGTLDPCSDFMTRQTSDSSNEPAESASLTGFEDDVESAIDEVEITNTSDCRDMVAILTVQTFVDMTQVVAAPVLTQYQTRVLIGEDGGAMGLNDQLEDSWWVDAVPVGGQNVHSIRVTSVHLRTLVPGQTKSFQVQSRFIVANSEAYTTNASIQNHVRFVGVAA